MAKATQEEETREGKDDYNPLVFLLVLLSGSPMEEGFVRSCTVYKPLNSGQKNVGDKRLSTPALKGFPQSLEMILLFIHYLYLILT